MQIETIKVGVGNCYLIQDEGLILIDGGSPNAFSDFSKGIQRIEINPKEIGAVIITHCHWDHIGYAKAIKDCTEAKIIVHKNEKNVLEEGRHLMPPGVTTWGKILGSLLEKWSQKFQIEPCEADIVIGDNNQSLSEFGINGKIVFAPGHSFGSISIVLDSGDAFVGDMAMNSLPMTIQPSLPIFAENVVKLNKSWKKLIDMGIKTVYPAHGKSFPIEKLLASIKQGA